MVPDSSYLNVSVVVPSLISIFFFVRSKYRKGNSVLKLDLLSNDPSPYSLFFLNIFQHIPEDSSHISTWCVMYLGVFVTVSDFQVTIR